MKYVRLELCYHQKYMPNILFQTRVNTLVTIETSVYDINDKKFIISVNKFNNILNEQ